MPDEPITPAPDTAPAPDAAAADWRSQLPEDIRGAKPLADFKDIAGLAKSYVSQAALVGSSVRIPGADAKPEERDAFYNKLGRPEAADKYAAKLSNLPTGHAPDPTQLNAFFTKAHAAGLTDAQAQTVLDFYGEHIAGAMSARAASYDSVTADLKKEWGGAYDANVKRALRGIKSVGGDEMVAWAEQTGEGNNPVLIKAFAKVGRMLEEDDGGAIAGGESFADLEAKIESLKGTDPKGAFWSKEHPDHKKVVAEVNRLSQALYDLP